MISMKSNQCPISPSLILSSLPSSTQAALQVIAKDGRSELPCGPLLLLSSLLRPLLSQSSTVFTISLPSHTVSTVSKLGELLEQGTVKVANQEEADDLIEAAGMLGVSIENTQLIRSNRGEALDGNDILSHIDITRLSSFVAANGIEPVESSMKAVQVVLRGVVEGNTCELCGQKFKDRNASKMHMRKKHKEIHLALAKLCIGKVLHPTISSNKNCLVDSSDNLTNEKENTLHSGREDSIKDELQRSSSATYSCILCDLNYRSKKNFNRHVKRKHARANQDALLSLVDENEQNKSSEKLVTSLSNGQHDNVPPMETEEGKISHFSQTVIGDEEVASEKDVVEDHEDDLFDIVEEQEGDLQDVSENDVMEDHKDDFVEEQGRDLQYISEKEDLPKLPFEDLEDLEDKLSENNDISNEESIISGENDIGNIPETVKVKPGPKLEAVEKQESNDIICIGPVDVQEDTEILLSSVGEESTKNTAVDCCMLCGFTPRHQYVLWEHYLRHHFRHEMKQQFEHLMAGSQCILCRAVVPQGNMTALRHIGISHLKLNTILKLKGLPMLSVPDRGI